MLGLAVIQLMGLAVSLMLASWIVRREANRRLPSHQRQKAHVAGLVLTVLGYIYLPFLLLRPVHSDLGLFVAFLSLIGLSACLALIPTLVLEAYNRRGSGPG
ncbi:MAG: hypothetical protein AB1758_11735 [Candidatus Eremiobacterota bacterium]